MDRQERVEDLYREYCAKAHEEIFGNNQIAELQQQLADYEKKLEQSNNTIDRQSSLILEQNEFIKAYNQNVQHTEQLLKENAQLKQIIEQKDKEIEMLKANQTPTDKELKPQEYDNYNLADKLRYRDSQIRIALERLQKLDDELFYVRHQICEEIRGKAWLEHRSIKDPATRIVHEYTFYTLSNYELDQIEKGGEEE